ncbi:MAG: sigma-54 dependent transcriptional regulator [Deltaproteobacteria bacterium]|jgi:DNA-binding NtrC family response regulator|nr:sigma-54 dependent transcriptional regulator [Deltaproteobacteria bacterium]
MRAKYILVAEVDRPMRSALFTALTRLGHAVELAEDGLKAQNLFLAEKFDLVLAELRLPKLDGLSLLKEVKRLKPETPVVVMSSGGSVADAVTVMREGADDYLVKPFPNEVIEEALRRAFKKEIENETIAAVASSANEVDRPIVAQSPLMGRLLALAKSLANSSATVLLQGESGTGKELLARFIHKNSPRANGPFVAVNCAGLPESLLESELFGHEKGAFTGALAKKPGKFDLAHNGTLLLDEISEMDISLQAKLLRALQEGEIDPVGGKGPHKVDVRVIATTNRRLKDWVDAGQFRADLYYRLNVMPFYIPALRERAEDVVVLAEHFREKYAAQNNKDIRGFSPEALETLAKHNWPGNIRELENTIARATLMAQGQTIEDPDIFMDEIGFMAALERNAAAFNEPKPVTNGASQNSNAKKENAPLAPNAAINDEAQNPESHNLEGQTLDSDLGDGEDLNLSPIPFTQNSLSLPLMTINEMERQLIGQALTETAGNRTKAAYLLGISVRTLRNKLNDYREMAGSQLAVG